MKRTFALLLLALLACVPMQAQRKCLFGHKSHPLPTDTVAGSRELLEVLNLIDQQYVSDPDNEQLCQEAIRSVLRTLDPHSIYIPAKDVQRTNEALQGNFEGVGISFTIAQDTVRVQEVIAGGPAEKVGVMRGDKILRIDGVQATGDSARQSFIFRTLRGKKGTTVITEMLRGRDTITFHIERDKIPIHSVEVYFMEDDSIGYISLLRFARTSVDEFRKALRELQRQGMRSLILDLRGNSGGYLDIAYALSNEFISPGRLIVYQQGRNRPRQDFRSVRGGSFRNGDLVVMIDENSASAAEIVSGAVQDWDRGLIVGRRSFGKGLVQTMYQLSDGSQIRLTTARYYTPSGRCIQKSYDKGVDEYNRDFLNRYKHGEMFNADSIQFPDSLKFKTASGRTVYGGGGIMPDIFIPMDTTPASAYYRECRSKGLLNQFPQQWADRHRKDSLVADFDTYLRHYDQLGIDSLFALFAAEKGVNPDTTADTALTRFNDHFLGLQIKGLVADCLFGRGHYYRIMKTEDPVYNAALAALRRKKS